MGPGARAGSRRPSAAKCCTPGERSAGRAVRRPDSAGACVGSPVVDAGGAGDGQEPADETRSPVAAYLHRLHDRHAAARDGAVADLHPRARPGRPRLVRHLPGDHRRRHLRGRRLRASSRSSRSRSRSSTGMALEDRGRRSTRRGSGSSRRATPFNSIIVDEHRPAVQPDGERRRDRDRRLVAGAAERRPRPALEAFGGSRARELAVDEDGLRVGERPTGHRNRRSRT